MQSKTLYSVGLDVGTTTTQMVISRLQVENRSSGFTVPQMVIGDREVVYESPVIFTPVEKHLVDGKAITAFMEAQYEAAGLQKAQIDTGAVIVTGETSRKENAHQVLSNLSGAAGSFVVATAGPDLESILAAKGAGATEFSRQSGQRILHIDIGGGTSNMALIENGQVVSTGCFNVGGRLLKLDESGKILYRSPVLEGLTSLKIGDSPTLQELTALAEMLCSALEMASGRKPETALLRQLETKESQKPWAVPEGELTVSFSGGVADCIEGEKDPFAYGDLGVLLGKAIRKSSLCASNYRIGSQTIRATVIGAGCHSTALSGSTVYRKNVNLPLKNLPVVHIPYEKCLDADFSEVVRAQLHRVDSANGVLYLEGLPQMDYALLTAVASGLGALPQEPLMICMERDFGKALGQKISLQYPHKPILCLDGLLFEGQSYLDVGSPVGPCYSVVMKTLVLQKNE